MEGELRFVQQEGTSKIKRNIPYDGYKTIIII